jgi:hypothetical protein
MIATCTIQETNNQELQDIMADETPKPQKGNTYGSVEGGYKDTDNLLAEESDYGKIN